MRRRKKITIGVQSLSKHFLRLFTHPLFIGLTIIVNCTTLGAATILYHLEAGINPAIHSFLDTFWWATATVTTVGYGEVVAMTQAGRALDIVLMIIGTTIFLSYIALFTSAFLGPAMKEIEEELHHVEEDLEKLREELEQHESEQIL